MNSVIGSRIKSLREERGLLQQELADIMKNQYGLNTNRVTISKWENGKQEPEAYNLRVLAQIFGVTMEYIAGIANGRNERRTGGLIVSQYDDYDVFYDPAVFENETPMWRELHSRIDRNKGVHDVNVLLRDCTDDQIKKIIAMIELLK